MKDLLGEDLFEQIATSDAICITTNCTLSEDGTNPMGGGSAGAAARRWPELPEIYGNYLKTTPNVPVVLGWVDKNDPENFVSLFSSPEDMMDFDGDECCAIVAFPTMHDISEPADADLVFHSAVLLAELADHFGWKHVVLGRPGCGIGGLDYDTQVKPELEEIFDDRFTVIHKEFFFAMRIPNPMAN